MKEKIASNINIVLFSHILYTILKYITGQNIHDFLFNQTLSVTLIVEIELNKKNSDILLNYTFATLKQEKNRIL